LVIKFDLVDMKIESLPSKNFINNQIDPKSLESLQIKIYEDISNNMINRYIVKSVSGKYSITIEEGNGQFLLKLLISFENF